LRLLAHSTAEAQALASLGDVEIVIGDIGRPDTARRLLHGVGTDCDVIHTAGIIHPRLTREFFEINANGTRHVVEAAAEQGIRRLVHVSSNSPFGTNPHSKDTFRANEPYNPYYGYGLSKMQAELAVFEAVERGLDATIVRPPWFYGPFQPPRQTVFFRMIRAGRFPVVGDGEQRRSMVYIDNLVDGVIAAELTPAARGKAYWIADRRPYSRQRDRRDRRSCAGRRGTRSKGQQRSRAGASRTHLPNSVTASSNASAGISSNCTCSAR
jgi:nucleoside-diphosphate-sugar epimerase